MARERLLGSALTLLTLLIGIAVGFPFGAWWSQRAIAQRPPTQQQGTAESQVGVKAEAKAEVTPSGMRVEYVRPTIIGPSIGTNMVFANRVQADFMVEQGYDLLKLQQNLFNVLAKRTPGNIPVEEINTALRESRVEVFYRVGEPPKPQEPEKNK